MYLVQINEDILKCRRIYPIISNILDTQVYQYLDL